MSQPPSEDLRDLARSFGVQLDYVDMAGRIKSASTESLMLVLKALGAELSGPDQARSALRERRLSQWRRRIEPVVVAWAGTAPLVDIRLQSHRASAVLACRMVLESGDEYAWTVPADQLEVKDQAEVEGERFLIKSLPLPSDLPTGYHRLTIEFDDREAAESLVIAAPIRAYSPPYAGGKRPWGVFAPLYALHSQQSWGGGDLTDLEALMDWTASLGGGLVATLPMLATNFDGPSPIISPYSPTSRLFWNEFYLGLDRSSFASTKVAFEAESMRTSDRVQYGRQMALKRMVVEDLAERFFESGGRDFLAFDEFLQDHPDVESYAFFQAAGERFGRDWRQWPAALDGPGRELEIDLKVRDYHLFAQWQTDAALRGLAEKARSKGLSWYLDFPIGVDFNSFDVWRERDAFAIGASVGCPPDPVFTRGQNWGFPPLHPDRQREQGYRYLIASFRNHFRYANALRIDHVMGLHRLFWIPDGAEAKDGAFVSTPSEEIYAVLSVESHRNQAWVVGEDLGTVPPEVEGAMNRHGVRGMYVLQYELRPDPINPLRPAPETTVASVNTHDMPPFASFWEGLDLVDRHELGLLDDAGLEAERANRHHQRTALTEFLVREGTLAPGVTDAGPVLHATWEWLAKSPTGVLLVNVEDLWLETESQNTPNTYLERPNWQRKLRRSFEDFSVDPEILSILRRIDALRS